MRRLIPYVLFVLLLAGTLGAVEWNRRERLRFETEVAVAQESVRRLSLELRVRAATNQVALNGRGWPETIDPAWFGDYPPMNPLMSLDRPWLEVAGADDESLADPAIRQAVNRTIAAFWYNPATGTIRARIGPRISDALAIKTYNLVNSTNVEDLFDSAVEEERERQKAEAEASAAKQKKDQDPKAGLVVVHKGLAPNTTPGAGSSPSPSNPDAGAPNTNDRTTPDARTPASPEQAAADDDQQPESD